MKKDCCITHASIFFDTIKNVRINVQKMRTMSREYCKKRQNIVKLKKVLLIRKGEK